MPKNMTGGSGHKRSKRGDGFRGLKAKAGAMDLLEVLLERAAIGLEALAKTKDGDNKVQALKCLQVGRIDKMLGNGWCDVTCEDNKARRCHIRGILRSKKGGAYMGRDSLVVVSLEKPLEEVGDSDEEGLVGPGKMAAGVFAGSAFVVGLFDDDSKRDLKKAGINPTLFEIRDAEGKAHDDYFDRGEEVVEEGMPRRARKLKEAERRKLSGAAAAGGGGGSGSGGADAADEELNADDL